MKKILLAFVLFGATIFGANIVNAKEISLNDIDTNTYIIGDRIYELNTYFLSIYDIVSATNEYAKNHNGEIAPIYYVGETGNEEKYLLEILGTADNNGVIPTEYIEDIESVYPNSVINATAINNSQLENYIATDIEPLLKSAAETLNATAEQYGFSSVTYENKTLTFNINKLDRDLADYKDSGILGLAQNILNNATKVEYGNNVVDLTVLNQTKLTSIAKDVLQYLAGSNNELNYASVANKSVSAKITFNNGSESSETYKLSFVYNVEEVKDAQLEEVAKSLNKTASQYGFSSITYDKKDKKASFVIGNADALLVDYKDSGIVSLFMANIDGASKVTYTINNQQQEIDLSVINDTKVINLAMGILGSLAGEGAELTLGSVAGKSISADVLYVVGGVEKTITYEIEFVCDIACEKDETLEQVAGSLNETAGQYGFESITYDKGSNTATFTISNPNAYLADYKDSGFVALFMANVDGASKMTYTINNQQQEVDLSVINDTKVINLAMGILGSLAGEGVELTLGAVAGKSISADVQYVVDGVETNVTYTISFVMSE